MGTNLRALVREYKGKKLTDGKLLSGKDRLTIIGIDAIQNVYGRAIRDNKLEEIWAILDYYSSTESNPKHDKCPKGEKSWCSYQRDQVTGSNTYISTKAPLPDVILDSLGSFVAIFPLELFDFLVFPISVDFYKLQLLSQILCIENNFNNFLHS